MTSFEYDGGADHYTWRSAVARYRSSWLHRPIRVQRSAVQQIPPLRCQPARPAGIGARRQWRARSNVLRRSKVGRSGKAPVQFAPSCPRASWRDPCAQPAAAHTPGPGPGCVLLWAGSSPVRPVGRFVRLLSFSSPGDAICSGAVPCLLTMAGPASQSGAMEPRPNWRTDVPHAGWDNVRMTDLEPHRARCEMCGQPAIRFQHTMRHADGMTLDVGCVCAGHMEANPEAATARDRKLRHAAVEPPARRRRAELAQRRWLDDWKTSQRGNRWRSCHPYAACVAMVWGKPQSWCAKVVHESGKAVFLRCDTLAGAKRRALDAAFRLDPHADAARHPFRALSE